MPASKRRERNICSIDHCRSYREAYRWPEPLPFHEFPADLNRRKLWLEVLNKPDWIPGDKAKICGVHFTPDCYRTSELPSAQKRLNSTAVPSLHLNLEPLPDPGKKARKLRPILPVAGITLGDPLAQSAGNPDPECVCAILNCDQYRETNRWPVQSHTYHEIPLNPEMSRVWLQILKSFNCYPQSDAKICSMHFKSDDFMDSSKLALKPSAVPSLNFNLRSFTENYPEVTVLNCASAENAVAVSPERRDPEPPPNSTESGKRFSNIIVVDLVKESKKAKPSERNQQAVGVVADNCPYCLERKKDLREAEFQVALLRKEVEDQKKIIEKLKEQTKENCA